MYTREQIHSDREKLIDYINGHQQDINQFHNNMDVVSLLSEEIQKSNCDKAIDSIRGDIIEQMQPSVDLNGHLFGSVSESVRQEVMQEANGVISSQVESKHISPDDMEIHCENQKHDISEELIRNMNVEADLLRYLEMYNDLAKAYLPDSEMISEKVEENSRALDLFDGMFGGVYGNQSSLYGIAVTDFVTDGGSVDISSCKKTLVDEVNKDIKSATFEEKPGQIIEDVRLGLQENSSYISERSSELKAVFDAVAETINQKSDTLEVD